jgi:hypothetical protein
MTTLEGMKPTLLEKMGKESTNALGKLKATLKNIALRPS